MFSDSLDAISRRLGRAGYHTTREPIDIGEISSATDCEIIARNDEYAILYMEAESNWRDTAHSVAKSQSAPCLVATKYGDSMIMTTIQNKMTRSPKPRHIVITSDSEKYGLSAFVRMIRSADEDDFLSIDDRVQKAFDVFSKYDEAIKKFGENLEKVIKDVKRLIIKKTENNTEYTKEASKFSAICKEILNDTIQSKDITDMLIQHVITAKIFATVYDYDFVNTNNIAGELERLRKILDISDDLIDYSDILLVAESITSDEERQQFIRQIYETFYQKYDPKRAERDGIVYTPTEVVDFILNSVQHVLQTEFGVDFSDRSVKVLDPFTGTGTFVARLLASGMLSNNLTAKYKEDIFANELLLLAFYIATVNMESTYVNMVNGDEYIPFEGMNYTDTLMMNPRYLEDKRHRQEETKIDQKFVDIRRRRQKQRKTNLHVIVGNPPYSVGQSNYNDQNQNVSYPEIDERIKDTYISTLKQINPKLGAKNAMYDSYIRSIRWASDRIGKSGIIGFVTNGSFIRSEAAAGVRACFQEEFTDVWVFDLRGNQRTQGEISKKEGGKIFGSGSRAPVAVTILVKNSKKITTPCTIRYSDIGDYHSRENKLDMVAKTESIKGIQDWQIITPDKHHDWINQRTGEFSKYLPMGSKDAKKGKENAVFQQYWIGVATSRDPWAYNSSGLMLMKNMKLHIDYCNSQDPKNPIMNSQRAKWSPGLSDGLKKTGKQKFDKKKIRLAVYRPFFKQYLYLDKIFTHRPAIAWNIFPENNLENLVISIPYRADVKFSAIITDTTPDIQVNKNGQCFPLKIRNMNFDPRERERERDQSQSLHNSTIQDTGRILGLHNRHDPGLGSDSSRTGISNEGESEMMQDNITDTTLKEYRTYYNDNKVTKTDIFYYVYGLLHHPIYRKKYANNLTRELPHIPMAPDFWTFSKIGKKLADLHLSYETCPRYDLGKPINSILDSPHKIRWGRQKKDIAKNITSSQNKHVLIIDDMIIYDNLPVCKYHVNGRTPLEWFVDRYKKTQDEESEIENWPLQGVSGKDVRAIIERLAYVGSESDSLIAELPDEFEPEKYESPKAGLDSHM